MSNTTILTYHKPQTTILANIHGNTIQKKYALNNICKFCGNLWHFRRYVTFSELILMRYIGSTLINVRRPFDQRTILATQQGSAWYKNTHTNVIRVIRQSRRISFHNDDVIKWKHFPRNWPFVRGIHRSRWIPHTKASDAGLWCFLWFASE